jgi:hypothetical protein
MKPLPRDVSRCSGEDCKQRDTCHRFLTIGLDEGEGRYAYSFFNPEACTHKIEVENEETN